MATQINITQKKPSNLGGLFSVLGTTLGAAAGSVVPGIGTLAGAGLGASIGGATGRLSGGLIDAHKNKDLSQSEGIGSGAISRRLQGGSGNPLEHVSNAMNLLGSLSPAIRSEVAKPLGEAYQRGYFDSPEWKSQITRGPHL